MLEVCLERVVDETIILFAKKLPMRVNSCFSHPRGILIVLISMDRERKLQISTKITTILLTLTLSNILPVS